MNDNVITFSGWVGSRVEVNEVREGISVATFRVGSTPRRFRDGRWENGETVWYAVKAWRALAGHVAASLRSGDPVLVTGRLVAETWQKEDGTVVTRHVVVAMSVGHDLTRGTTAFTRSAVPESGAASEESVAPETAAPQTSPRTTVQSSSEPTPAPGEEASLDDSAAA